MRCVDGAVTLSGLNGRTACPLLQASPARLLFFSDNSRRNKIAVSIQQKVKVCVGGKVEAMFAWALPEHRRAWWEGLRVGDACLFGNARSTIYCARVLRKFQVPSDEEPWGAHIDKQGLRKFFPYLFELSTPVDTRCTYQALRDEFFPGSTTISQPSMLVISNAHATRILQFLHESLNA